MGNQELGRRRFVERIVFPVAGIGLFGGVTGGIVYGFRAVYQKDKDRSNDQENVDLDKLSKNPRGWLRAKVATFGYIVEGKAILEQGISTDRRGLSEADKSKPATRLAISPDPNSPSILISDARNPTRQEVLNQTAESLSALVVKSKAGQKFSVIGTINEGAVEYTLRAVDVKPIAS